MGTKIVAEPAGVAEAGGSVSAAVASLPGLVRRAPDGLSAEAGLCFQEGMGCLERGEAREAIDWFEKTLATAPEFADGHIGLGIAYALEHRIYPALDHLERATALEPANFHAHFKLGQLCFKLRVPQKGYEEMSRALACVRSLAEKKLVAQLLREERQREKNDVRRPWWHKPFSPLTLFLGVAVGMAFLVGLSILLR